MLSYYRASTFLPCRIPKMNKLSVTVVKNQPFQLLWCPFLHLRLKLNHLERNSIVTRELIPLLYVESANQNQLQSVKSLLLRWPPSTIDWFFIFALVSLYIVVLNSKD